MAARKTLEGVRVCLFVCVICSVLRFFFSGGRQGLYPVLEERSLLGKVPF